jgi:chromosome segregation ATPase
MSETYIYEMMKRVQNTLKNDKNDNNLEKTLENEIPQKIKGGSSSFNFMKHYLDMVFSKKNELKKEQEDSFQRLTRIKESEKIQQQRELEKQEQQQTESKLKEDELIVLENKENIKSAEENVTEVETEANEIRKQKEEALKQYEDAEQKISQAESHLKNTQSNAQYIEEAIQIKNKAIENANTIIKNLFEQLENRELISLEKTKESMEENEKIQFVKNRNVFEKKTDDLLI